MDQSFVIPFDQDFEQDQFAREEMESAIRLPSLLDSPSYRIAFEDQSFIMSDVARSIRMEMEAAKTEWILRLNKIRSTIIVFGSARFASPAKAGVAIKDAEKKFAADPQNQDKEDNVREAKTLREMSAYYEQAREFARIVSEENLQREKQNPNEPADFMICTGGGPGIMEAANRGASEAGARSIGLNIKLPFEQQPNPYITPELCFQFHYFAIRKLHFMLRAKALVTCPGGFGTFDELFEALTLRQTRRMQQIPIILFGEKFWRNCINFDYLVETGVINREDLELFYFTESAQDAWDVIKAFHRNQ